jgi:hypothetical protein
MCHIDAWQQRVASALVSEFYRSVIACMLSLLVIICEFFKFQEFKLDAKRAFSISKCSRDFLVRAKLMNAPLALNTTFPLSSDVSNCQLRAFCFQVSALSFPSIAQHFGSA